MVLGVVCGRGVLVEMTGLVHAVVQGTVGAEQGQAHAFVGRVLGAGAQGIEIGQGALDLLQDGESVGRCQQLGAWTRTMTGDEWAAMISGWSA